MPSPAPLNPRLQLVDPKTGFLTADGFRFLQNLRGVVVGDDGSGDSGVAELNDRLNELSGDASLHIGTHAAKISALFGRIQQVGEEIGDNDESLEALIQALRAQVLAAIARTNDAELLAIAKLVSAANKLPYFTGAGRAALTDLTAFARTLLDDADASTARSTLGLAIGSAVQAYHARLADIAGITYAQGDILYHNGSNLVKLAAGTSGHFLKTNGAGANPAWAAASGASAVAARINKNGVDQAITGTSSGGSFTKVQWGTADFDPGSWFDNANDRLTVGATGKYLVSALVHFTGGVAVGDLLELRLYINGGATTPRTHTVAPAAVDTQVPLFDVLNLTSGDYVELYAQKGGADSTLYGNVGQTYMTLSYLGA